MKTEAVLLSLQTLLLVMQAFVGVVLGWFAYRYFHSVFYAFLVFSAFWLGVAHARKRRGQHGAK